MSQRIPVYQIDAFTDQLFGGNPAAVCPLESWLPTETMQAVATENNLSETAFFVARNGSGEYDLRWFTPAAEVDLCGHATLASAHLVLRSLAPDLDTVRFHTASGPLEVSRDGELLVMDFPARPPKPRDLPAGFEEAIGLAPAEMWSATKNMAVFETAAQVRDLAPNLDYIAGLDLDGLICTAPGDDCDFVSRYFAPHVGIPEDPVTGSAHCTTVPFWAERLGKTKLHARQISARGGELFCEAAGDRVRMAGHAVMFLSGTIDLP
jgi:PhzF family phenazine biosynthesis protein